MVGAPWNVKIDKISNNAKWIWSASDENTVVYFRIYLGL
jgi:deoxyribodipyrimidine photolyase